MDLETAFILEAQVVLGRGARILDPVLQLRQGEAPLHVRGVHKGFYMRKAQRQVGFRARGIRANVCELRAQLRCRESPRQLRQGTFGGGRWAKRDVDVRHISTDNVAVSGFFPKSRRKKVGV